MSETMITDPAYLDRVTVAMQRAVFEASLDPDKTVATVLSGEVAEACITLMAFVLSGSTACASPTATRKTCDLVAKKLQQRIRAAQTVKAEVRAAGTLNLRDINIEHEIH